MPLRPKAGGGLEGQILELQSTAGNVAVQRLLGTSAVAHVPGRPLPIQREAIEAAASGPSAPPGGILTFGRRGEEVRSLQARLNELDPARPPLALDGIFGRRTQRAVRRFQRAHPPLAVDGDAGPETMAALAAAPSTGAAATVKGGAPPVAGPTGSSKSAGGTGVEGEIASVEQLFATGKEAFAAGQYGLAYDEFSKAHEISGDSTMIWNRAQALRLLGGRRADALALYEQFLASNADADVQRRQAREHIEALRGPGRSGDRALDAAMADMLYRNGRELYVAGSYAAAYDEFTKAWEINGDIALTWNRAQALRLAGGQRAKAIELFEQFLASDADADDQRRLAREHIAELRGPGRSGDSAIDMAMVNALYRDGQAKYQEGDYIRAFDEFSKAWEITSDPALLFNRAQALRLAGGRREEAITLYEQFVASDAVPDAAKDPARRHLAALKGPGRASGTGGGPGAVGAPMEPGA